MKRIWAWWYVWLWGVLGVTLVTLPFFVPFKFWALTVPFGFFIPELIGLRRSDDAYPPLTHVIRRWSPRWFTYAAIYGLVFGAGAVWWGVRSPAALAALGALLGWLTDHFRNQDHG